MNSLKRLIQLKADVIYPAHGPVLKNATETLQKYVAHRTLRENQVIAYVYRPLVHYFILHLWNVIDGLFLLHDMK